MRSLAFSGIFRCIVFVFAAALTASIQAAEITMSSLSDDMTNLAKMAEFPDPPYVAKQCPFAAVFLAFFSSRTSG